MTNKPKPMREIHKICAKLHEETKNMTQDSIQRTADAKLRKQRKNTVSN